MSLRKIRGRWQYRFKLHGHPRVEAMTEYPATEQYRQRAERAEREHRDALLRGLRQARRAPRVGFSEATMEFLSHLDESGTLKQSSLGRIETSLRSAQAMWGDRIVSEITPHDIEVYRNSRIRSGMKPVTVKHDLDALSKFFRWAVTRRYATVNVVHGVDRPSDRDSRRQRVLSSEEEHLYFVAAAAVSPLLADVARIILDQGMRPEEVLELRKDCIDVNTGRLFVRQGKTAAARRWLRMTPAVAAICERRMAGVSEWLFPSPRYAGRPASKLNGQHDKALRRCGLSFRLYDLRHTFATRAVQMGVDLVTLAALMGHSTIGILLRYAHPTAAHMDAAMDRLGSRGYVPTKNPVTGGNHSEPAVPPGE